MIIKGSKITFEIINKIQKGEKSEMRIEKEVKKGDPLQHCVSTALEFTTCNINKDIFESKEESSAYTDVVIMITRDK